jgi:DnaJ-class molecular chaperone
MDCWKCGQPKSGPAGQIPVYIDCDVCEVNGIPTGMSECEICEGDMQVFNEEENKWELCGTCRGTGKLECYRCAGLQYFQLEDTTCDEEHGDEE